MTHLYQLWTSVGRLCRALTAIMNTTATAVEQATADAEARLQLPAPASPEPVARLPLSADTEDPDADVPRSRRPAGRNGHATTVAPKVKK